MVKSPGVFDGRVGFQSLPFSHEIRLMVAVHEADEHFRHDRGPDRSELFAATALLRLLEDVVPERRVLMQAVLLCDRAIRSLRDLGRA